MVVISVKQADGMGFLFETKTSTLNDDLIESLVNVHNARLQAQLVAEAVRGLAAYGPMRDPQDNSFGLDIQELDDNNGDTCTELVKDPTGTRIGIPPNKNAAETLKRVAQDIEEYVDKSQVQNRVALTEACINDKLSNVRGAVMIAYPMGLPEWDIVKLGLDSIDSLKGSAFANQLLTPATTSLWVAGREFQRGKLVSDRLGKNEKTKVIAKLSRKDQGPPGREPVVNEEERKAMMAHYFKRQEELKKLGEADDDDYLNSEWADTRQMKNGLQGLGNVKAPGMHLS